MEVEELLARLSDIESRLGPRRQPVGREAAGYAQSGNYSAAAEIIDPNASDPEDEAELHIIKAELYYAGGLALQASHHCDKAVEICSSGRILMRAAAFYHKTFDWAREVNCYYGCLNGELPASSLLEVLHNMGDTVWLSNEYRTHETGLPLEAEPGPRRYCYGDIDYMSLDSYYANATGKYEALAASDPGVYRPHLAAMLVNAGDSHVSSEYNREAAASFKRAAGIYETLALKDPSTWSSRLAAALVKLGGARMYDDMNEAEGYLVEALLKCPDLARVNPHAYSKAYDYLALPYRYGRKPNPEKAEDLYMECASTFKLLAAREGVIWKPYFARALWRIAELYLVFQKRKELGREVAREALRLLEDCEDGLLVRKVKFRIGRRFHQVFGGGYA